MPNRLQRRRTAAIARKAARKAKPAPAPTPIAARRIECSVPVQIAAADGQSQRKFSLVAYTGEPMRIGWWDYPVVVDLDTLDLTAQRIPALFDHCTYSPDYIVGQVEAIAVKDGSLIASGIFTPTESPLERNLSQQVLQRADAGYQWQASIGGDPSSMEKIEAGNSVAVNGRTYPGPVYVARGVVLREISFVVLGGDRRTSAVVARYRRIKGAAMSFEEWLLSMGFEDAGALSEVQKANLQQMYNAEYPEGGETETAADDATPTEEEVTAEGETEEEVVPTNAASRRPAIRSRRDPVADYRRRIAAEDRRIEAIRNICAESKNPTITVKGQRVSLQAHAIAEGWDTTRVELEALRSNRPTGPAIISRSHDRDCTIQAMQGAMILRSRGRIDNERLSRSRAAQRLPAWLRQPLNDADRNRIMEAAHKYESMSLLDVCREAIRIDGRDTPHDRDSVIQAAFSGSALTNIFTTSVNAMLLTSYLESPDTTVGWVEETDVADFKTNDRIRVDVGDGLTKLPRGGEADHADYADSIESYKIARYAKQFVIDEQDIIDDSLGALSDTPRRFGEAAARLRPDLVYYIILSNPTLGATSRSLFNSTDGNLLTTATFAAATLRAAVKTINLFRENSVNLNLMPTHVLVPPSLRHLAYELTNSSQILVSTGNTSGTERGVLNALAADGLTPVSEARLENGVVDPSSGSTGSGSATTWYVLSTMARLIEVGYLSGTGRSPQVRPFTLDKGKWGIGWDVKMDVGAKALDWKGMVKNTA